MNSLNISGKILGAGTRGSKYPSLWLRVQLEPIVINIGSEQKRIDDNVVFVNANYPGDGTGKAKVASYILDHWQDKYVFCHDITATPIRRTRKNDAGEWENYDEFGLNVNISRISLLTQMPNYSFNIGMLKAKVARQKDQFCILSEEYRLPTNNEKKSREIPLFIPEVNVPNLVNKDLVIEYKISGKNFSGDSKTFCLATKYISL